VFVRAPTSRSAGRPDSKRQLRVASATERVVAAAKKAACAITMEGVLRRLSEPYVFPWERSSALDRTAELEEDIALFRLSLADRLTHISSASLAPLRPQVSSTRRCATAAPPQTIRARTRLPEYYDNADRKKSAEMHHANRLWVDEPGAKTCEFYSHSYGSATRSQARAAHRSRRQASVLSACRRKARDHICRVQQV
jgi:hypothetical protein